ncbi:MAG: tetratricopeptide repeat protein [Armatimonadota bacterium]|nr:tetratricopeptide repeat protein [Armatimonadota bacterium]
MATGIHIQSYSGSEAPTALEGDLPRDAYTLLAQANLLRMRGQWPEAVEKCMKALRLAPDNASAQSLLGDIYENQGLLDDAIQWYRMALDVYPDSPADKMKLARVIESKSRMLPPHALRQPLPPPSLPAPQAPSVGHFPANPETLVRRTAYSAGALTLLVILAALAFTYGAPRIGKADHPLSVPTVVVPATVAAPNVTSPAPTIETDAAVPSDPAERELLNALRAVPTLSSQGVAVVAVESDPRAGQLTLTVICQLPSAAPGRDLILRDALSAAQAAVQVTSAESYSQFTVRCLSAPPAGGGSTPLLFVGDATRAAVTALPSDLSAVPTSQILTAFSNPWWSSVVTQ